MRVPRCDPGLFQFLTQLNERLGNIESRLGYVEMQQSKPKVPDVGPQESGNEPYEFFDMSSATTLTISQLNKRLYINCTSASNLTLPDPIENKFASVVNVGSATITVKDSAAATVGTVAAGESKTTRFRLDSSGVVTQPTLLTADA